MSQEGIIDVVGSNPDIPTDFIADTGSAVPIANQIEFLGEAVAAGTTPFKSTASGNTVTYQVQRSQAIAATNVANVGLSAFDSADFTVDANGFVSLSTGTGFVTSVSGTANRITSTGGTTPVIDIAATYVGQTSITTLGTVGTGTWNATKISEVYGGTNQTTYATGDILYASAANTLSKLAASTNGFVLTLVAGLPVWSSNGTGDVTGPASSTDNAITRYDGTTGKLIQNSNAILDDIGNLTLNQTTSTTPLILNVLNSDTNAASTSGIYAGVVGASAADPFLHVSVNAVSNYCLGIDNSDSDKLKITFDSVSVTPSSGNNLWTMTSAGERTMPLQPAFLAYQSANVLNTTGAGTVYTIGSTALTEVFDRNSDFNTNGTFTAPVTGVYQLCYEISMSNITAGMTTCDARIVTSNRSYLFLRSNPFSTQDSAGNWVTSCNVLADMDAGDTATSIMTLTGGAGDTATVRGSTVLLTFQSGYLVA